LNRYFNDIGIMITGMLEEEFRHLMNNDGALFSRVDARIRNARFLAEFVKFRVYPASRVFALLDKLLENFSHNNIDVTCTIIESCGPYLLRGTDSRHRMDEVLQKMWRLRAARNLGVCGGGLCGCALLSKKEGNNEILCAFLSFCSAAPRHAGGERILPMPPDRGDGDAPAEAHITRAAARLHEEAAVQ
jgi:hypothetical protein